MTTLNTVAIAAYAVNQSALAIKVYAENVAAFFIGVTAENGALQSMNAITVLMRKKTMTTAYNRILNPRPPRAKHSRYMWLAISEKVFITSRYTLEVIRARQFGSDHVDVQFNLHHLQSGIVNSYPSGGVIEKSMTTQGGFRITPVHVEVVDHKPQRVYIHVAFENLPSHLQPVA